LAPRSHVQIARVVETERYLFPWEVNHHTYKVGAAMHAKSHHFRSLAFQSFIARCTALTLRSMAGETIHDLRLVDQPTDDNTKSDSEVESTASTTSSPTPAVVKMADGKIL
jgi:hypothetical protein